MGTKNIVVQNNTVKEFEKSLNDINAKNSVFATQTHVTEVGGSLLYTAVVFCRVE
jgi:hypothetical protein